MTSLLLKNVGQRILPLLLLFAVFLLARGHQAPGGGFAAGLVLAVAVSLCVLTNGVEATLRLLPTTSRALITMGWTLVAAGGVWGLGSGGALLEARWTSMPMPGGDSISLGTTYLFECGICLLVAGGLSEAIVAMETCKGGEQ